MKVLNEQRIPLISRGSGTNLCGGTVPVHGGIVMVMHRMNAILDIDLQNLTAAVQPGIITKQFNEHIENVGLFYPPHPSSMAISTIGGNIAECSGGLHGLNMARPNEPLFGLPCL